MESEFSYLLNQFGKWSIFNIFIYLCYTKPLIRLLGFLLVFLIIFAGFFKIIYHGYNLSYEADRFYILIISLACIIGNMKDGYTFKQFITNTDNIWGLKNYDANVNSQNNSLQTSSKKEIADKIIKDSSIEKNSFWKKIKLSCNDYFYNPKVKDNVSKDGVNKEEYTDPFVKLIIIAIVLFLLFSLPSLINS